MVLRVIAVCTLFSVPVALSAETKDLATSSSFTVRNFVDRSISVKDYADSEEASEYAAERLTAARDQIAKYYKENSSIAALHGGQDRKTFLDSMARLCSLESTLQIRRTRLQRILAENKLENLDKLLEIKEAIIFDIDKLKKAMGRGERFPYLSYIAATNEILYEWDFPPRIDQNTQISIPTYLMLRPRKGNIKTQVDETVEELVNCFQNKAIEVCAYKFFRFNVAYIQTSILEEHPQVPKWFGVGVANYLALTATMNIYGPEKARYALKMYYVDGDKPLPASKPSNLNANFDESSANSVRWAIKECEQMMKGGVGEEIIGKLLACGGRNEKEYIAKVREQFHIDLESF